MECGLGFINLGKGLERSEVSPATTLFSVSVLGKEEGLQPQRCMNRMMSLLRTSEAMRTSNGFSNPFRPPLCCMCPVKSFDELCWCKVKTMVTWRVIKSCMSGPGPPELVPHNNQKLLSNFRLSMNMDQVNSETSDVSSLNGDLMDIALGSDLDGLTDNEVNDEINGMSESDDDDGVNVTIKEGIKPNYSVGPKPKVASIMVVPEATKRSIIDLIPKQSDSLGPLGIKSASTALKPTKSRNKNGSAKRQAKNQKNRNDNAGSLMSMLSRVGANASANKDGIGKQSTPKRMKSPGSDIERNPTKQFKSNIPVAQPLQPLPSANSDVTQNLSYREVVLNSLKLKVCLKNRCPVGKELSYVKDFLTAAIEDAVIQRKFVPIFGDCNIGNDGVYTDCSDSSCADWLMNITKARIPKVNDDLIVIPQGQQLLFAQPPSNLVRTVCCVPNRKGNEFILAAFAQLNKNINTENWRITSRRHKGPIKTTLFMRMDKESFGLIGLQGNLINWILGKVRVEREHQRSKAKQGNSSSVASQATANNNPKFIPSSSEVMAVNPGTPGLIREEGSGPKGNSN